MAMIGLDRDSVLTGAIAYASADKAIWVVYKAASTWIAIPYTATTDLIDFQVETTRYVLPNGEVTKLS